MSQNSDIRNLQSAIGSEAIRYRIFATVGSDVPFDRMIKALDKWAASRTDVAVFAQIGRSSYRPQTIESCQFLTPTEFSEKMEAATLIVAHAGMGTILSALQKNKPIIVIPRRGSLGETRNEHQVATVERLSAMGKIDTALDEAKLVARLDNLDTLSSKSQIGPWASKSLTEALRCFIDGKGVDESQQISNP